MICFTGDMHGDFSRFSDREIKKLKKGDTLIVCGDFGFVWDGSREEQKRLAKIGKRRHYTLFAPGANENYGLLAALPETELFGGRALQVSGNLYALKTGEVYTIDGKRVLCFAGGEDMDADIAGKIPAEGQLPSLTQLKEVLQRVKTEQGGEVDYIVSYEPPLKLAQFMDLDRHLEDSFYPCFLDTVSRELNFVWWYFGKHHRDKKIPPKYQAVYQKYYF